MDEYYEAGRKSLYGLDGTQVNIEDAYTNFTKSQELGNADANFYLGLLAYEYGYPEQDYEEAWASARQYYEQSGDNPYAQVALGVLYYYGEGVEEDKEKGEELFQSAVDKGVVEGYYGLAIAAYEREDYETVLEYYNRVAEEGSEQYFITSAMCNIGSMYAYGWGFEQDIEKALEWYAKAADSGDTSVMTDVGDMYARGWGFEQDAEKAIEWYAKAADLGDTNSMRFIGYMYMYGDGVEQNDEKAIEWYAKAVSSGSYVEFDVLVELLGGYDATLEWFTESGDIDTLVSIGFAYEYGNGIMEQDYDKAVEWYQKAADLGNEEAQEALEWLQ